MLGTFAVRLRK